MARKRKRESKQTGGTVDVKFGDIQGPAIDVTGAEIGLSRAGNQRINAEFGRITADNTVVVKGAVMDGRVQKKS